MVVMNPSSFGLPPHSFSDPLYLPAHYESAIPSAHFNDSLPPPPKTDKAQHWRDLGWEVRPDGYPITNLTAADCKSYSAECRHTYKDTFLAWDFLVELDKVKEVVGVIDRWDIRERALEGLLNVTKDDIVRSSFDSPPHVLRVSSRCSANLTTLFTGRLPRRSSLRPPVHHRPQAHRLSHNSQHHQQPLAPPPLPPPRRRSPSQSPPRRLPLRLGPRARLSARLRARRSRSVL